MASDLNPAIAASPVRCPLTAHLCWQGWRYPEYF